MGDITIDNIPDYRAGRAQGFLDGTADGVGCPYPRGVSESYRAGMAVCDGLYEYLIEERDSKRASETV